MSAYDLVIIGAGVSGLSLAHYAKGLGLRAAIIEQTDRVGGAIHTQRFGDDGSDFWLELGAHTCYNSYSRLLGILEDLNIIDQLLPRQKAPYRMLFANEFRSIPSQVNILEFLVSIPRIFFTSKERKSVATYYSRVVGKKNFEKVFCHLFDAVPSQRANDFPADTLFKRRPRRKDILRSFTLKQGLQSMTDALSREPDLEVFTGSEVVAIESRPELFAITTANGGRYSASHVALAAPANAAARLVNTIYPDLANELGRIDVVQVETTGVAVDTDVLGMERIAGIVAAEDSFYSVVSRDTVPHDHYRGFTFHFKPDQLEKEEKISRIADVLGIPSDKFQWVTNKRNVLPCFRMNHEDRVKKIDALIAEKNILMTGNYFNGMSIEDCVLRSLSEANRVFRKSSRHVSA